MNLRRLAGICKAIAANNLESRGRETVHSRVRLDWSQLHRGERSHREEGLRDKIKICRREAKESRYWLRLIDTNGKLEGDQVQLLNEAQELMKIFGAIVRKSEQ